MAKADPRRGRVGGQIGCQLCQPACLIRVLRQQLNLGFVVEGVGDGEDSLIPNSSRIDFNDASASRAALGTRFARALRRVDQAVARVSSVEVGRTKRWGQRRQAARVRRACVADSCVLSPCIGRGIEDRSLPSPSPSRLCLGSGWRAQRRRGLATVVLTRAALRRVVVIRARVCREPLIGIHRVRLDACLLLPGLVIDLVQGSRRVELSPGWRGRAERGPQGPNHHPPPVKAPARPAKAKSLGALQGGKAMLEGAVDQVELR